MAEADWLLFRIRIMADCSVRAVSRVLTWFSISAIFLFTSDIFLSGWSKTSAEEESKKEKGRAKNEIRIHLARMKKA